MNVAIWATVALVAGMLLVQAGFTWAFARAVRRAVERPAPAPTRWPKFGIVLPVRGGDADMLDAIRSVLAQDYPALSLRIVVDGEDDPAWPVIRAELERLRDSRVQLEVLDRPGQTCSLVCSSVLQAVDHLEADCELIAFLASDMTVPRDWLRTMAAAMVEPGVGCTLGNRWYLPPRATAGSITRYLWNAAAAVPMWAYAIPWSGGVALWRRDVAACGLRELWSSALVEDVGLNETLQRHGRQLRFTPTLLAVDHGEIGLGEGFRFIRRQLLWVRLYHPQWRLIAAEAALSTLSLVAPAALFATAILVERIDAMAITAAIGVLGLCSRIGLLRMIERAAASVRPDEPEISRPFAGLPIFAIIAAIPLTQFLYAATWLLNLVPRHVVWRQVNYEIRGPFKVRRMDHPPFRR